MTKLSRREKKIMEMRFGLNNQKENSEGSSRYAGYITVLHFKIGKRFLDDYERRSVECYSRKIYGNKWTILFPKIMKIVFEKSC